MIRSRSRDWLFTEGHSDSLPPDFNSLPSRHEAIAQEVASIIFDHDTEYPLELPMISNSKCDSAQMCEVAGRVIRVWVEWDRHATPRRCTITVRAPVGLLAAIDAASEERSMAPGGRRGHPALYAEDRLHPDLIHPRLAIRYWLLLRSDCTYRLPTLSGNLGSFSAGIASTCDYGTWTPDECGAVTRKTCRGRKEDVLWRYNRTRPVAKVTSMRSTGPERTRCGSRACGVN